MAEPLFVEHEGKKYAFKRSDIGDIMHTLEACPRLHILGCERCKTVCFHKPLSCACCIQYRKTKSYPEDGKHHKPIYEADAFLNRLKVYTSRTMQRAA